MNHIKLFETHTDYETYINDNPVLPNLSFCLDANDGHYTPKPHDYSKDYLTMKSLNDEMKIYFGSTGGIASGKDISYSLDNGSTWVQVDTSNMNWGEYRYLTTINTGEKVLFKGTNYTLGDSDSFPAHIIAYRDDNGQGLDTYGVEYEGNIMSMLYGDDFQDKTSFPGNNYENQFAKFCAFSSLVYAHNLILPVTTLTGNCYQNMFYYATSLLTAPKLPATTLAQACYYGMFNSCTSLTTAPVLPATTLANQCYGSMFYGCTNLNYVKAMFTTIASYSLSSWLSNVSATGTFVKNSSAQWENTDVVPSGWTVQTANA